MTLAERLENDNLESELADMKRTSGRDWSEFGDDPILTRATALAMDEWSGQKQIDTDARNLVVHGGSVVMDVEIIKIYTTALPHKRREKWCQVFNRRYGVEYEEISRFTLDADACYHSQSTSKCALDENLVRAAEASQLMHMADVI